MLTQCRISPLHGRKLEKKRNALRLETFSAKNIWERTQDYANAQLNTPMNLAAPIHYQDPNQHTRSNS